MDSAFLTTAIAFRTAAIVLSKCYRRKLLLREFDFLKHITGRVRISTAFLFRNSILISGYHDSYRSGKLHN